MNRIQRGATLLEAILAAAVVGIIMAYTGRQALLYAERNAMEKQAEHIGDFLKIYSNFLSSPIFKVSAPVEGRNYVINDFWKQAPSGGGYIGLPYEPTWGLVGKIGLSTPSLADLKLTTCTKDAGKLNPLVTDLFIECGQYDVVSPLKHYGTEVFYNAHSSIVYPDIRSQPIGVEARYILLDVNDWDTMMGIAVRIPEVKFQDGFRIGVEDIEISGYYSASAGGVEGWEPVRTPEANFKISDFLNGDFAGYLKFRDDAIKNNFTVGLLIRVDLMGTQDLLKADGSVPLDEGSSLCWSNGTNNNLPCIGAVFNPDDPEQNAILIQNNLKVDGDLIYKDGNGDYRTPVIAKYNSFVQGTVNTIGFIDCPLGIAGEPLEEKIALVPSSVSTATETTTDFTNPSGIISTGTRGAGGKHAFTSGFSLEWEADNINQNWIVRGAIGIDAAYAENNNNLSVVRNPRAMSFISLQWCE